MPKALKLELKTPIPLTVEPAFLLLLGYIGWIFADGNLERGLLAAFCAAASILLHELGHALSARAFGCRPSITLKLWGGETNRGEGKLSPRQEAAFIAAGPLMSFALCGLGWLAVSKPAGAMFFAMNLVWGLLNSAPILPLDGGHLTRLAYLRLLPRRTPRDVQILSAALGLAGALLAAHFHNWELALLALFLMFTNISAWQSLRLMSDAEFRPEISEILDRAAEHEKRGELQQAIDAMLPVRSSLGPRNTCAIALLYFRLGRHKEALEILEALHAARKKDWSIALLAARCHAAMNDVDEAARWLKDSLDNGMPAPSKTLADCAELQALRGKDPLRRLLSPIQKA